MKLFITGTNTGIGKTWVSAALLDRAISSGKLAAYYKPVQTGSPSGLPPEDPHFIDTVLKGKAKTYYRYCFEMPVAPSIADSDRVINIDRIIEDVETYASQSDLLLVEGAGGLAVPISPSVLMIDLIQRLEIPAILVANCRLGTINHTLLSVEALTRRGIQIHAIVLNFYPRDINKTSIAVKTLIPTLREHLSDDIPLWISFEQVEGLPLKDHLQAI